MERKNERVFYTLEDKTNTEIHSYSDAEIQQNLKKYEKKSRPRRSLMLAGFVVSMIVAVNCNTDPYSFFSYIAVILFAAGELLSETLYWLNRKSAAGRWYVEIVVDRKKEIETYYQNSATTGPDSIHYYPVIGRDTTTGYSSVWYLDKDTYQNVKAGDIIKKTM